MMQCHIHMTYSTDSIDTSNVQTKHTCRYTQRTRQDRQSPALRANIAAVLDNISPTPFCMHGFQGTQNAASVKQRLLRRQLTMFWAYASCNMMMAWDLMRCMVSSEGWKLPPRAPCLNKSASMLSTETCMETKYGQPWDRDSTST